MKKKDHRAKRTCAGCRKKQDKQALIRMVCRGDQVIVDHQKRLPGRGAYVCLSEECISLLFRGNVLNRAFRKNLQPMFREDLRQELFYLLGKGGLTYLA